MAKLIYLMITSLDGYIADKDGAFDWAAPDDEVHAFINELIRPTGTYLYGRRMYDVMAAWETLPTHDEPTVIGDFATIWRAADKIVYSKTLEKGSTARTRIERDFEPQAVRQLISSVAQDVGIGGPTLAAHAFKAGLIDVCCLFVAPIIVGGGKSAFPSDVRLELVLKDVRRFANGMVYLRYRSVKGDPG